MKKVNCKNCTVKLCPLNELAKPELELLDGNCSESFFKTGEVIFKQHTRTSHIVFIKRGLIKAHMRGPNSKDQILKIADSASFLGIPTVLGDKIYHYSATAVEPTVTCCININTFKELLKRNGNFAYKIIFAMCQDELAYFHRFVNQSQKHVNGRVADALLYFSNTIYKNQVFELNLTRNDLSDLIGTSRESVTRVLNDFKKEGIIDINGKKIRIVHPEIIARISRNG